MPTGESPLAKWQSLLKNNPTYPTHLQHFHRGRGTMPNLQQQTTRQIETERHPRPLQICKEVAIIGSLTGID